VLLENVPGLAALRFDGYRAPLPIPRARDIRLVFTPSPLVRPAISAQSGHRRQHVPSRPAGPAPTWRYGPSPPTRPALCWPPGGRPATRPGVLLPARHFRRPGRGHDARARRAIQRRRRRIDAASPARAARRVRRHRRGGLHDRVRRAPRLPSPRRRTCSAPGPSA
jgi:hypothetical protein